jgi:hypothetical protein
MQIAKVIEMPHLLYVGDTTKTFGITVQSVKDKVQCAREGYSFKWDINDRTILSTKKEILMAKLGLSEAEYNDIIAKIKELKEIN